MQISIWSTDLWSSPGSYLFLFFKPNADLFIYERARNWIYLQAYASYFSACNAILGAKCALTVVQQPFAEEKHKFVLFDLKLNFQGSKPDVPAGRRPLWDIYKLWNRLRRQEFITHQQCAAGCAVNAGCSSDAITLISVTAQMYHGLTNASQMNHSL